MIEAVDVLIVGAGISGIGAAHHVQARCPGKNALILEARARIGGTWDLFRYPGIRSDSDMHTLGFPFRPWTHEKAIADGASIRAYLEETARADGTDAHIRFGERVTAARWSSAEARWTVEAETAAGSRRYSAAFLYLGTGYYDYAQGHRPDWPGEADFVGRIVHPQSWPDDLDWAGQRVIVIGSGATAVTLAPALAGTAAGVVMLQRSPSYVVARPADDAVARRLGRILPARAAARLTRWKNALLGLFFFTRARQRPDKVRALLMRLAANELPPGYDVERHFGPAYKPWDQRVCLAPDGDLFRAIREGRIEVVTDTIETFTKNGIKLVSGREIAADIVVTATGLDVKLLGGIALEVDGAPVEIADRISYKGMMLDDVPNLVLAFGYTNASWTLKSDLTARYFCRLVNHMDQHSLAVCVPRLPPCGVERRPLIDFSSGYVQRAAASLPGQGPAPPWRVHQNYLKDRLMLGLGTVTDDAMEFRKLCPEQSRRGG